MNKKMTLMKSETGIRGLDEITNGGLPRGRSTLITGGPGCGKTLLGVDFLVKGATKFNEKGVFIAFEESIQDLCVNVASLNIDLQSLCDEKKIIIDFISIDKNQVTESGDYNLEGIFIRLDYAISSIGAKRIVLDNIQTLFLGLLNPVVLRLEMQRLLRWLKEKKITAIITGEPNDISLTHPDMIDYVSDCVIGLNIRTTVFESTRHLRIIKYRGSAHDTNEFPFVIDEQGLSIFPFSFNKLEFTATLDRVKSGIAELDNMLDNGAGFYKGSIILVSGSSGTGKSSFASCFCQAACARGEKVLYLAFEESAANMSRNMDSIGVNLQKWIDAGFIRFQTNIASTYGLEKQLSMINSSIVEFKPQIVIIDPISSFNNMVNEIETKAMLLRLVNILKNSYITGYFTSLSGKGIQDNYKSTKNQSYVSSLVDSWIYLRNFEINGETNRTMCVIKARGIRQSNQIREVLLTNEGIKLQDIYFGSEGMMTGSSRVLTESKDRAVKLELLEKIKLRKQKLVSSRKKMELQIEMLRSDFQSYEISEQLEIQKENNLLLEIENNRELMSENRVTKNNLTKK